MLLLVNFMNGTAGRSRFSPLIRILVLSFGICYLVPRAYLKMRWFVFIPDASVGAPTEASESYIRINLYCVPPKLFLTRVALLVLP